MAKALGGDLSEFDYLVLSDDRTRQGALRFLGDDMALRNEGLSADEASGYRDAFEHADAEKALGCRAGADPAGITQAYGGEGAPGPGGGA